MTIKHSAMATFVALFSATTFAQSFSFKTCDEDPAKQQARGAELQILVKADQDDRSVPFGSIDWQSVLPRDEARRKRVGEIFGEGCFKTAADYAAAALVYQHGNIPDHFFQTFLWSKKAVELGDESQKWLMAAGIDRYLVRTGYKQLFATQASIPPGERCWCLDPVEESFPESKRVEYTKRGLAPSLLWINTLNKDKQGCENFGTCRILRKNSPQGTVPGFW